MNLGELHLQILLVLQTLALLFNMDMHACTEIVRSYCSDFLRFVSHDIRVWKTD